MKSIKSYLDELVDSVQDIDQYYGITGRKDYEFDIRNKRYKKARSELRKHIIELRKRKKV